MKKSRTRIKRTVTKKPRRRVRPDPKVKVDFYIKNVTVILNNYIDKSEITSILGYKFKDGSKIFSADHKDLNYELINMIKTDKKYTLNLISKKWNDADDLYFNLKQYNQANNNFIERQNSYFYISDYVESGIQCENPMCRSFNTRIKDLGSTGDEPSRVKYSCNMCPWSRRV